MCWCWRHGGHRYIRTHLGLSNVSTSILASLDMSTCSTPTVHVIPQAPVRLA